jgi:hypothetical protein
MITIIPRGASDPAGASPSPGVRLEAAGGGCISPTRAARQTQVERAVVAEDGPPECPGGPPEASRPRGRCLHTGWPLSAQIVPS